jgi:RNA recognition motif-containing protein
VGVEVYVGQLSGSVTEKELRSLFSVVGTVESVHLVVDAVTGKPRGCGYVRMASDEEAREAIDFLNGSMLGDRLIVVRNVTKKFAGKSSKPGGGNSGKQNDRYRKI